MNSPRILVLGKGVIGLACARELALRFPRARVSVLESPTSAMIASRAAAGMLAPFAEFSEDAPLGRLGVESLGLYPEFARALETESGMGLDLSWSGTLIPDSPGHSEVFDRKVMLLRERGVGLRLLEGRELRTSEPELAQSVSRALWLPEGLVNPRQLHEALSRAVAAMGIRLHQGRIVEVFSHGNVLNHLQLDDGRKIDFDMLLAATGAWTDDIAQLLDLSFSIRPIKGQLARIGTPDGFLRHVLHLKNLYLAPRSGEGLIVGSTMEDKGFDQSINQDIIALFFEQATELVPGLSRYEIAEAWVGFRPRSADGLPIIGWSDRWENLLIATGHFRNGILLTPLTARIVGELMENPGDARWNAFSPNRAQLKAGPTAS